LGRLGTFVITVVLILGLVGCAPAPTPTQYYLTTSSTEGGNVSTPREGTSAYNKGTVADLVAEAEEGYRFVNWTGDVETIADVNAASTTITISGNYSIKANFERIPPIQYNLTISRTAGGSVTTPGQGIFTYDAGTVVNMVATPASGYRFVYWTGDVATLSCGCQSTTITMNGNYSVTANFQQQQALSFPDPNLEAAVREATGKPTGPIYPSDLEGLTSLDASVRNIADLTGLEHCASLMELELWANQISDIAPLANLTNLIRLWLEWNQIGDLSPLADLTNLTVLDLYQNQIINISPLVNLTNLTRLYLTLNQIRDVSPLTNLTNLTLLQLDYNQINDIRPLVQNEGLGSGDLVSLRHNPLSSDSINLYIPQLEARGVTVQY
jgi:hypothetical protein